MGPPAGLPLHPSLRRFAFTFLLSAGSLQISSVSSVEGFPWETQSFPLAAGTRKCSPEGLEEPRRKRRGLLPSPFGFVLSSGASSAFFILGPCLPAFACPSCRLLLGVGEWRRQIGLSVPTLSPGHFPCPYVATLRWETLAVRNPRLQKLGLTRQLPLLLPSVLLPAELDPILFPTVALNPEVPFPFCCPLDKW